MKRLLIVVAFMVGCSQPAPPTVCDDHGGVKSIVEFTDRGGNSVRQTFCEDGTRIDSRD